VLRGTEHHQEKVATKKAELEEAAAKERDSEAQLGALKRAVDEQRHAVGQLQAQVGFGV
jgi:hypothetical protein